MSIHNTLFGRALHWVGQQQGTLPAGSAAASADLANQKAERERAAAAEAARAGLPPNSLDPYHDQMRNEQVTFINALKDQAAGKGPSIAQDQLRGATDANIRQAMALGQSQRGVGYQANLRGILSNQARTQQESALQSSLLRNQEMMQGRSMLGQTLGGVRGQDVGMGTDLAKLRQNWEIAKLDEGARKRASDNQLAGSVINAGGAAAEQYFNSSPGAAPTTTTPTTPTTPLQGTPTYQAAHGGLIPGDSPKNDTVPAMLSPGEIVIPRSVAQSEDAPDKAAEFVAALKAQKGAGGSKEATLKKILERLGKVEQMAYGGRVC